MWRRSFRCGGEVEPPSPAQMAVSVCTQKGVPQAHLTHTGTQTHKARTLCVDMCARFYFLWASSDGLGRLKGRSISSFFLRGGMSDLDPVFSWWEGLDPGALCCRLAGVLAVDNHCLCSGPSGATVAPQHGSSLAALSLLSTSPTPPGRPVMVRLARSARRIPSCSTALCTLPARLPLIGPPGGFLGATQKHLLRAYRLALLYLLTNEDKHNAGYVFQWLSHFWRRGSGVERCGRKCVSRQYATSARCAVATHAH